MPEPASIETAPYIKGTLEIQRVVRRKYFQGVIYLEFFRLFSDEDPFYTQYYRNDDDPIVCGHRSFDEGPINCTNYFSTYQQQQQGEEWMKMKFPTYKVVGNEFPCNLETSLLKRVAF